MKTILAAVAGLAFTPYGFAATHVFWYKALTNGYNLQAGSPGPGIPAGALVHEGMIASGGIAQYSGSQSGVGITIGSGLDDAQGRCGYLWSKDLCTMGGSATVAKVRAEFRDGWCDDALCNAGPIDIRLGVVDFQGNVNTWGGVDLVPESADWQDFLNPLGSAMGYDLLSPALGAEEVLNMTAPAGRPGEFATSVLDGQFMEIDVTDQVNYILQNPGEHAIVFLVDVGQGSTGKINSYTEEGGATSVGGCPSDNAWTQDANTAHLWVESANLTAVERKVGTAAVSGLSLSQNLPNPFTAATAFSYHAPETAGGTVAILDVNGRTVFSRSVRGSGVIRWKAPENISTGVYLYRLTSGSKTASGRMILVR